MKIDSHLSELQNKKGGFIFMKHSVHLQYCKKTSISLRNEYNAPENVHEYKN